MKAAYIECPFLFGQPIVLGMSDYDWFVQFFVLLNELLSRDVSHVDPVYIVGQLVS